MAQYAVGDIQGCYRPLREGLDRLQFDPAKDILWCAGDLVNRGPQSLDVLRFLKELGDSARLVLGNHDLHLLAAYYGQKELGSRDTAQEILDAPDCDELIFWLRSQPLLQLDTQLKIVMTHAGLPPMWTVAKAQGLAKEVSEAIQASKASKFFASMYGNSPDLWSDDLEGTDRLRLITNYLTRMRFISPEGKLDFTAKGDPAARPFGHLPWYELEHQLDDYRVVFGHWAALKGETGHQRFLGLDTGCVWGGCLTFCNLEESTKLVRVECS